MPKTSKKGPVYGPFFLILINPVNPPEKANLGVSALTVAMHKSPCIRHPETYCPTLSLPHQQPTIHPTTSTSPDFYHKILF